MTVREYFEQAHTLDEKINFKLKKLESLREMKGNISSVKTDGKVKTSQRGNASFVRSIENIMEMEEKINEDIDLLVKLKKQIQDVIDSVPDDIERMILDYYYLQNYTLKKIGEALFMEGHSVRRRLNSALEHVILPENPIMI